MHVDFYNPELKAAVDPEIPQKSCEFKKLARETRPLSQLFLSQPAKKTMSRKHFTNHPNTTRILQKKIVGKISSISLPEKAQVLSLGIENVVVTGSV